MNSIVLFICNSYLPGQSWLLVVHFCVWQSIYPMLHLNAFWNVQKYFALQICDERNSEKTRNKDNEYDTKHENVDHINIQVMTRIPFVLPLKTFSNGGSFLRKFELRKDKHVNLFSSIACVWLSELLKPWKPVLCMISAIMSFQT